MPGRIKFPQSTTDESGLSITAAPLSLRANDAARLLGTTTCFIEEILRAGELSFVTFGKRRIIFVTDLIAWAQKERSRQLAEQRISVAA
jgi:excisionase family DNA binding protein